MMASKKENNQNKHTATNVMIGIVVVLCLALVAFAAKFMFDATAVEKRPHVYQTETVATTVETTEATEATQPTVLTEETEPSTEATTEAAETTEATTQATTEATEETTEATEETTEETTEATEETTEATEETEPETQPPTTPNTPSAVDGVLAKAGLTRQSLADKNCNQLITVEGSGNTARIRFFTNRNGQWEEMSMLACSGFLGRNGATGNKREGDGCTPTGLYPVGKAFYQNSKPLTGLDSFQITWDTYWVDDPNSQYYNKLVIGNANKDWKSAESMGYISGYRYGFVVDYNTERIPGKGSAIFFHISSTTTAGCIATNEAMVLEYLKQLDKNQNPYILIVK